MPTMRNRYSGYGGGGGGRTITLGLPPFTRAIKWLVISNAAIYLLLLILEGLAPAAARDIFGVGALVPYAVTHGWVWQLITYSFLHAGFWHITLNMLLLWMWGATLEMDWGFRQFLEFYFFCVVGAALTTIAVSYLCLLPTFAFLGVSPLTATVGASGGVFGVMMAFAVLYGDQMVTMFPIPFTLKAKYVVGIMVFFALAAALGGGRGQSIANFAHLGGALFGYLYLKFVPRRGLSYFFSERYYGVRNGYYRWKRRRAARKFQVYMRKQDPNSVPDMKDLFDEYGNYRPPRDKGNGESKGRGGWVN
jgi:membrane associated rhomboid family serine protease